MIVAHLAEKPEKFGTIEGSEAAAAATAGDDIAIQAAASMIERHFEIGAGHSRGARSATASTG